MVRRRGAAANEDGFTILEVVIAMALLAVVATGFAASAALGFRTIAVARQRTTASELATARLEHLRNIPYDYVALSSAPAHNPDPEYPDYWVSADGSQYDVTGNGQWEDLIVDVANGGVLQVEDPIQVGSTVMEIYQYVTWVDDPAVSGSQDYRRVTVVVRYKAPAVNGVNKIVRSASLFTKGTVTYELPVVTTVPPSPTTVATTTTTPSPTTTSPSCVGDATPPTGDFTIGTSGDSESGYTASTNVTLVLSFTDVCTPIIATFSNDGITYGGDVVYDATNPLASWSIGAGNGIKTVFGRVRDGAGNQVDLAPQSITLDASPPSAPASVNATVSCSGSDRTVTLSWSPSTDNEGNLRGYRVYRSTDQTTWNELTPPVVGTSKSDTHSKNLDSVRYYVVAYDKAGNVSSPVPNPPIAFSKGC